MSIKVKRASAKVPAALSSIFSPKLFWDGKPRERAEEIGARGGGFALANGVETWVEVEEGEGEEVEVNGRVESFPPSTEAAETMRRLLGVKGFIRIRHRILVPIGTGFGTSAAAALGVILSLSKIMEYGITLQEACRITHEVELRCRTGLNSEVGIMAGGLVLVLREGAPPRCMIDTIPLPRDAVLVAVVAGELKTSKILSEVEKLKRVEKIGDRYMERILSNPTPENFLKNARGFAYEAGFVTREVEEAFEAFSRLPTLGYAQNMLGKAAHALVRRGDVSRVERGLRDIFPEYRVVVSEIGYGVRASREV